MSKRFSVVLIVALLASLLGGAVTSTPVRAAGVLYVKPGGNGNCSSWANACTLQTAIESSFPDDQIWVQMGTYKPHASDRTASFVLQVGVAIYGGFAGTENDLNQRNWTTNITILSGDIGTVGNPSDNSYHVVVGSGTDSSAILDGFTIRGGNADGSGYNGQGGGMFINAGSPTLMNLRFLQNSASSNGGGLSNESSSPTLSNLIFESNVAFQGAGIWNNYSHPILTNVIFSSNKSASRGGGMRNWASNPTLINVTFSDNSSADWGGGIHNTWSNPLLRNVTFKNNSSAGGGGLYNYGSSPTLINVTFSGNSATYGGGMRNDHVSANPKLINVTFFENTAMVLGGGIYNDGESTTTLTNTIIAHSINGGDCVNAPGLTLSASSVNNLIEDQDISETCGLTNGANSNIVGADPNLSPLTNNGGFTQTHALLGGSPAINAGTNGDCPAEDQRGISRPQGGQCDIGAFELPFYTISGNTTTAGVTLSYVDGTPKTAISQNNGNYSFMIPWGWSGTVTPSKEGFTFSPPNRTYPSVTANQAGHNYTATPVTYKISGNAGAVGVTLNYNINGVAKTATSLANGTYSFAVPWNWSGTVTPSHPCYTFNPASKNYANVTANQTQNYSATFNAAANCANISVKINGASVGTYGVPFQGSLRMSYAGINNGTVNVTSTNGVNIIAAERVNAKDGTRITHFSELMGLPQNLVSTTYAFPAYDNSFFDSQLRIGNVSNSNATVRLYIGGVEKTSGCTSTPSLPYPYVLAPSASLRVSCPGVSGGPVRVVSNVNIIAAMRVLYNNNGTAPVTSFSELMGLPASQWNTTYWMPWYNNVDLNTQLRIGNVSNATATVRLYIGGVEKTSGCTANSPYTLAPYAHLRVSCPGVNSGPVQLVSTVPIVTSQRVAHFNGTKWNDFSELMALPASQLTATYLFPWYNNKDLDTQLRFGNVSNSSTAHVNVFIGGVKMPGSPFTVLPGASLRKSFAGINNGPVKIVSDVNIVASMRVLIDNGSAGLAFSELMGLPQGLLATSYVFPWYNNRDLDTQLRFGVP